MLSKHCQVLLSRTSLREVAKINTPGFLYSLSNSVYITRRNPRYDIKIAKIQPKPIPNLRPKDQQISYSELEAIEDLPEKIDTSLTPEQQAHVAMLKKQLKGAAMKPSPYRDVPKPHEIKENSGFLPNIPPNAEELIDWALAHIPAKGGSTNSRWRKRHALRLAITRFNHRQRKEQTKAAVQRKLARGRRIKEEVKAVLEEAKFQKEKLRLRNEARLARASKQQSQQ